MYEERRGHPGPRDGRFPSVSLHRHRSSLQTLTSRSTVTNDAAPETSLRLPVACAEPLRLETSSRLAETVDRGVSPLLPMRPMRPRLRIPLPSCCTRSIRRLDLSLSLSWPPG
jgi:hypothetical protein